MLRIASVAARYDLMNDLMSLGAHREWKRFALSQEWKSNLCKNRPDLSPEHLDRRRSRGRAAPTQQIKSADHGRAIL